MKILIKVVILLTLFSSALSFSKCLMEGQELTFTGTISRETFPGPPNYESINSGDTPETYWILTIGTPQCVLAESMEDGEFYEVAKSITRFQLAFDGSEIYKTQKDLIGADVVVNGQLFVAISGHHHTEVLISVKNIKPKIQ